MSAKVDVRPDVEYRLVDGVTLALDVHRPVGTTGPRPAVVYFHGGGWSRGTRGDRAPERLTPVAAAGIVVVSASYRFSQVAPWPAQLTDAESAVGYVLDNADELGVDPGRVSVWGASAGGHIATMLATGDLRRSIASAVAYHAPSDLLSYQTDVPDPGARMPSFVTDPEAPRGHPEARLVGASGPGERLSRLLDASPVAHVGPDTTPTLMVTGNQDALMPLSQPRRLAAALADAGVEHQLLVVDGATHEDPAFHSPAVTGAVVGWVSAHHS